MKTRTATEVRKLPQQARSREMVEAILDATAHILIKDGFAEMSTNRVAERAGASIGSLYQYFPSREALVVAVARRHSEGLKSRLEVALSETAGRPLKETLSHVLEAIVQVHLSVPGLNVALSTELPRLGHFDWKEETAERGVALARAILDNHLSELRPGLELDSAAFIMSTTVEGVVNATSRHRPYLLHSSSLARELADMLFFYIAGIPPPN